MIYNNYVYSTKYKYDSGRHLTMPEKAYTNIRLTTATRDRLKAMGFKGESFDDVLVRLLDAIEKQNTSETQGKPEGVPATS